MKFFEFTEKTKNKIVHAFNDAYFLTDKYCISDVMAIYTLQKHYGKKCKIRVFKTYINEKVYLYYEDNERILSFDNDTEAVKFALHL